MIRYNAEGFPDVTDAAEPFGAKSAVHELRKRSPFYWPEGATEPASLPRGGKPTASATDPGAENPWKNFNLTRQSELIARDPAKAQRLADEAGVPMIPNSGVPRGMR
jgi:hypothetical protein